MAEAGLEVVAAELAARCRGRGYGSVRVVDVAAEVINDVDDYLGVELVFELDNPAGETWPLDDIADLRRDVRAEVRTFPGHFPVYVTFHPIDEAEQEPAPTED